MIYFYTVREEYGCFSNFSPHGFNLNNIYWPTVEHYFQAQKFIETPDLDLIRQAKSPKLAAMMGRSRSRPLRSDWELVKDDIMKLGVLQKFQTHSDIREILLQTGHEVIIENSPKDYYWGIGKDGSGKNKLGLILMEVRQILHHKDN